MTDQGLCPLPLLFWLIVGGRHETLTHYICISYKSTISCFPNSL
jgi:hypothetical protein